MSRKRSHKQFNPQSVNLTASETASVAPLSPEIKGSILLALALCCFISTLSFAYAPHSSNWLGSVGHSIGKTWFGLFGLETYLIFLVIGWVGWRILFQKPLVRLEQKMRDLVLCITAIGLVLCIVEDTLPELRAWLGEVFFPQMWHKHLRFHLGGAPLYYVYHDLPHLNLLHLFNTLGVCLLAIGMLAIGLLYLCQSSPTECMQRLISWGHLGVNWLKAKLSGPLFPIERKENLPAEALEGLDNNVMTAPEKTFMSNRRRPQRMLMAISIPANESLNEPLLEEAYEPPPRSIEDRRSEALRAQEIYNGEFKDYALPSAELLTPTQPINTAQLDEILRDQADVLEETLANFGIEAKVGNINCGPTITSFEVHPAVGVKVQRIKALENDIALNLQAKSIRIIAPIPGKAAVGIEIPNPCPQEVSFQEILMTYQNDHKKLHIPLLLGKAVNGDCVISDLAKMPHLIIAGATGSGKSVCINTIVMSIVLNAKPDEIRLIMVDPKKVELTAYSPLPHMLAPVITEPAGACAALQWMVKEMENRYDLLKRLGLKNIDAFNNRTRNLEKEASLPCEVPEKLYYIVGIIDELADLMMVSSNDIEAYIARIAQMARAVGIHLILATQRPSREVITGLIKANFPTRISFKVASRVNSQIILDEVGAEGLMGNGDMLFLPPGTSNLTRAQGAYIRDEDINRVIQSICAQAPPRYIIQSFDDYSTQGDKRGFDAEDEPFDALYEQAKEIILSTGNASTTFLQRKLKIGYARAASLMDQLERMGIIGPAEGSKPRKILMKKPLLNDEDDETSIDDDLDEFFEDEA